MKNKKRVLGIILGAMVLVGAINMGVKANQVKQEEKRIQQTIIEEGDYLERQLATVRSKVLTQTSKTKKLLDGKKRLLFTDSESKTVASVVYELKELSKIKDDIEKPTIVDVENQMKYDDVMILLDHSGQFAENFLIAVLDEDYGYLDKATSNMTEMARVLNK